MVISKDKGGNILLSINCIIIQVVFYGWKQDKDVVKIIKASENILPTGKHVMHKGHLFYLSLYHQLTVRNPGGSDDKESAYNARHLSLIPGSRRSPGKGKAIHSSTLAWKIPWTEEPDRLQSMGSQRVGQDWATSLSLFTLPLLLPQQTVRFLFKNNKKDIHGK